MVEKHTPAGVPVDAEAVEGVSSVEETLRSLAKTPERHDVRVRLDIGGGLVGEQYRLDLEVDGRGTASCAMTCELSQRKTERQDLSVKPEEVMEMVKAFMPAMAADDDARQGGFPPCSLIGRFEVRVDGRSMVRYFMADPGQAETVGYKPPPYLDAATDALYRMVERRMGVESIRP